MTNEELYYLPASELLKHIQAEKERLIKEKVIKKSKPLPPITEEEKPYELPKEWEWVRLGDICSVISKGTTPKKKNGQIYTETGINFLRVENITNKLSLDISNIKYVSEETHTTELSRSIGENGDILVSIAGALGRVAIIESQHLPCNMNQAVAFVRLIKNYINIDYIKYVISSENIQNRLLSQKKVTAQPNLTLENISNIEIPLAPLYIQDQIVQKLEQLSQTKDSLLSHAESQLNYTKKMREALLQEAIRGELVPQDENDEPASILLEKIKTEKERLIKEKVIKKQKELPPITEEEKPYDLPEGWEWVRLGNIIEVNSRKGKNANDISNETWVLEMEDIEKNTSKLLQKIYNSDRQVSSNKYSFKKNDVLYGKLRPYLNKVLIASDDGVCSSEILPLQTYQIESKYIKTYLMSPDFLNYANHLTSGTRMPRLGTDDLRKAIFPLPPLAEQERIVAKLDELMANCDELEAKAEDMKNYTTRLFEASLKEAFMIE